MEYSCYTIYDRHTLADMSRALRKTVRKKTARRWWMAGCLLLVLGLSLLLEPGERLWFKAIILVAVVCLFVVQGWGDGLNALMAQRRMMPGSELCSSSFYGDHYECKISGATTSWEYVWEHPGHCGDPGLSCLCAGEKPRPGVFQTRVKGGHGGFLPQLPGA